MQQLLSTILLAAAPMIVQGLLDLPDLTGIIPEDTTTESETKQIINTEAELTTTTTNNNETASIAATDEIVSAPIYTESECNGWLQTLIQSDIDNSQGLSENEYHTFLSNINDPPYISQYFENIPTFDDLPWVFRVVHKSLACHCQKLGMDEQCCEGDDAEVLLLGFGSEVEMVANQSRDAVQEEYKDLFCQQIAYVLSKSVPSPSPTENPTESPSKNPSGTPTKSPSPAPVTDSPTLFPVTLSPTTEEPVVVEEVREIEQPVEEKDEGLSTGAIIGIVVAALAVLLALIALILYKRRKQPMESAPEADLEAPPPDEEVPEPQPEPEDDDESSAPSVWSDSDDGDDAAGMLVETEEDDNGVTAGSALAAMGAASTVAAQLSPKLSGGPGKSVGSGEIA